MRVKLSIAAGTTVALAIAAASMSSSSEGPAVPYEAARIEPAKEDASRAGNRLDARVPAARLAAPSKESEAALSGGANNGEAVAPPTYYNPSTAGVEHLLITDLREFEPTVDTLAAWVATFGDGEAFPDLVLEAWAADPEGCAEQLGVIQRRRALQEALSLYGSRCRERVDLGLGVEELTTEFAGVMPELEDWNEGSAYDILQRVSAETQITLWGTDSLDDADAPPAYTELLDYLGSSPKVHRAAEWLGERVNPASTKDPK